MIDMGFSIWYNIIVCFFGGVALSIYFGNIAGNRQLLDRLGREILSESLPHAHIIEGEEGSGRRSIALAAAAALSCTDRNSEQLPCGKCSACRKIFGGLTPDVIRLTTGRDKQSIGVDEARFIRSDIVTLPNDFDYKVYIIENADKMTPQAQNALLLTLEEPPKYAYFFLICRSASAMLETVRSRAPVLRTRPLDDRELADYIITNNKQAEALSQSSPEEFAELIRSSSGCIGQALRLLDPKERQPMLEKRHLARDFVMSYDRMVPAGEKIALISRFSSKREEVITQLEFAVSALRDLAVLKKAEDAPLLFWTDRDYALEISERFTLAALLSLIERTNNAADALERNANLRLTLTNLILSP